MGTKAVKMFLLGWKEYKDPYYQGVAAQLAFFFMLSIVPTLLILSQLLGLLDISLDFIEEMVRKYVEKDMGQMINYLVNYRPVASTNLVLILMAVWAASRVQFCLTRVTDYLYSSGQDVGNYWKDRFRAMITLVLSIIAMALLIIVFVYGEMIIRNLMGLVVKSTYADFFIRTFRWPVAGILYFLMVSVNYYLIPSQRKPFREIVPGSIFASVGMLVVTVTYSTYASHAVNYDLIYGSLASIIALMFWFYFISWVLFFGILCNKVWVEAR